MCFDQSGLKSESLNQFHLIFLQLLRPLNTLDDLCRLMQAYMNVKAGSAGQPSGVSVLLVSSELCNRLGACHITMCATGMQRYLSQIFMFALDLMMNETTEGNKVK